MRGLGFRCQGHEVGAPIIRVVRGDETIGKISIAYSSRPLPSDLL